MRLTVQFWHNNCSRHLWPGRCNLLHVFFTAMDCMPFLLVSWLSNFLVWLCSTSYCHLLCFVVVYFIFIFFTFLIPDIGWMHFLCVCVCVLSLPVQCWSLSYGKQRRPFRPCAPTWLRQQVWRTLNFFQISTSCFLSLIYFLCFWEKCLCIAAGPPSNDLNTTAIMSSSFLFYFRKWTDLPGKEKTQV